MKKITNLVKGFLADEKGAETVEWVMIAAVLAGIIATAFWSTLSGGVNDTISNITTSMETVTTPAGTGG
jgi:Flp pilus assembly pilin Flp